MFGANFVLGVILARLLSPTEFGLTGMLALFLGVANTFVNSGLGSALIQRKDLTDNDTTSCFWLNVSVGAVLAALLCAASPWVANFYGTAVLQPMLCVLSAQVVFGSLSVVQNSLRVRDLDFKTLAVGNWIATIGSGVCGVAMAWLGYGAWSLVISTVLRTLLTTIVLWWVRPWRPRGVFRWSSIQRLWPFSSRLLASSALEAVFQNASSLIIGKLYNAAELGLYTRARGFSEAASTSLTSAVGRVAFPYFSRLQTDRELMKCRLRQFLRLTAMFHFPAMISLTAVAPALVAALIGAKWAGCVPLVQVLSLVGLPYPLHVYHLQILTSLGRSDLFLKLDYIKRLLIVTNLCVTAPLGVLEMTWGMLVTSLVAYWLNSFYTRRLLDYSWPEQIMDLLPMLGTALITGAAGQLAGWADLPNPWIMLAAQVSAAFLTFAGLALVLRRSWFAETISLLTRLSWCPRWLVAGIAQ